MRGSSYDIPIYRPRLITFCVATALVLPFWVLMAWAAGLF